MLPQRDLHKFRMRVSCAVSSSASIAGLDGQVSSVRVYGASGHDEARRLVWLVAKASANVQACSNGPQNES